MQVYDLEPAVHSSMHKIMTDTSGEVPDNVMANYLLFSQAVSLRRIADTLAFMDQFLRNRPNV